MANKAIHSGVPALDEVLQGIRIGDNVVWQIEELDDYRFFARSFIEHGIRDGYQCVYVRFASHPTILEPHPKLEIIELDPSPGFDIFSGEVHNLIEERGRRVFYVFDNLSALAAQWTTDELVANFFQLTCPFLFELDTVAYFAIKLGKHHDSAVARIRETTQLLLNVYHASGNRYFHALKVWDRYSTEMFLPHIITEDYQVLPIFHSGEAARAALGVRKHPLRVGADSIAPWDSVFRQFAQHYEEDVVPLSARQEILSLKQELSHMMLGAHPELNRLTEEFIEPEDLYHIRSRIIGSGRIGGKATGMLLARRILLRSRCEFDFKQILEDHDSFYIGSDVFYTFLVHNNLFRLRLQLSRGGNITHEEFEEVERRFLAANFSREILEQFQNMLEYFGQAPIIVRSSSLLEDSFGNAFAGKYRSEFCANQGGPEERLEAFLRALKLVYASTLNVDALSYRRKRGLDHRDEQMALLVQRVSGARCKRYFFPALAGVAFSRNLFAWSNRIDPKQGIIRLVFGLGTRAVDRTGGDYPRMIPVSHPELRPEAGDKAVKYSQREIDVIDLQQNDLTTISKDEILQDGLYPNQPLFVSVLEDGSLQDPWSVLLTEEEQDYILTFNNLIRQTPLVKILGAMLRELEQAYGHPIDTEFTASVNAQGQVRINLLQCRPMHIPGMESVEVQLPGGIPDERVLFKANHIVNGGLLTDIPFIIYIDPKRYAEAPLEIKKALGRAVGRINAHPSVQERGSIMMGPGRWGSSHIEMGVNVCYADINNSVALVELAREESGQAPDVSYGTHFFQDLVEAQIIYLPVYPNSLACEFNSAFFEQSPNSLATLSPQDAGLDGLIRVIHVPAANQGATACVAADPASQKAVCYLA